MSGKSSENEQNISQRYTLFHSNIGDLHLVCYPKLYSSSPPYGHFSCPDWTAPDLKLLSSLRSGVVLYL